MEKVFDVHVHFTFEIPLQKTIEIFEEEFRKTGTEKYCFLSLPHHEEGGTVGYDAMQNLKGLYLKKEFAPNAYAFAGLVHPAQHDNIDQTAEDFLCQAKEYLSNGYDGIKMLEGYPSLLKAWTLPIDSPVYDLFYAYMEKSGYPILMHVANPKENWDITQASPEAIQLGRVYDSTYPTKEEITAQVFRIMERFPNLKLILAHFGFMSQDISDAERFMSYPNTYLDITPGGEQMIYMQKTWALWSPFWERYQERILYGTDFYAFPKDGRWEENFLRRPNFLRQFLESDTTHVYLNEHFKGVNLVKELRDKIYRENFIHLLGEPKRINIEYIFAETERLMAGHDKLSIYADEDLIYIRKNL